jgi:pimeloyl-ACP methyl ester carboxylesterase
MNTIRTPDDRFANLPDFPYAPQYLDINGARMHYLDEGDGQTILCLHGEPTWSFLYRRMIPPLAANHRVVAPDFFGFGRSDKFTEPAAYSYKMHYDTLVAFCDALKLKNITLVCQDWGGLLGLSMAGRLPDRFKRVVAMNTALATGDVPIGPGFMDWLDYVKSVDDLPIRALMQRSIIREESKSAEVLDAYDAPFPDKTYKVGAHCFPLLVPISHDDPGAAQMRKARDGFKTWKKPALLMYGDLDPVLGIPAGKAMAKVIPTAGDLVVIKAAGHFLQEDKGPELAENILKFMSET